MKTPFFLVAICFVLIFGCKPDPKPTVEITTNPSDVEVRDSTVIAVIDSIMESESIKTETESGSNNQDGKSVVNQTPSSNKTTTTQTPAKNIVRTSDLLSNKPFIVFKEKEHAFEQVKEGENIEHSFIFQNLGKKPLVISNASSPCSCTFAEFPLEPIMPGHSGEIKALFTTKGFYGKQVKTINVVSNAENNLVSLRINGVVEEVEAFAKEREEKTKQWAADKKEMERQQAEMKKALEEQKKKQALEDSIKRVQAEQALQDSLNRVNQAMEDSLQSGN